MNLSWFEDHPQCPSWRQWGLKLKHILSIGYNPPNELIHNSNNCGDGSNLNNISISTGLNSISSFRIHICT